MKFKSFTNAALLMLAITFAGPVTGEAAEYFVDQSNAAANDQNAGTEAQPWQTITKANETLMPGDTVYIKAGKYSTYIAPKNSGTATGLITYRNFGTDAVTITEAAYGILLDGKSYIVVDGINFTKLDRFMWLQNNANRNTISNCSFRFARKIGWSGSKIYRNSSYNWVHHNTFSDYGKYTNQDIGSVLDIGNEGSAADKSNYNLIENNTMFHGGHHVIGVYGMFTVVRSNYFHNEIWSNGHGDRAVYLHGFAANSGRNLIEGNRIAYSAKPPDNFGAAGMSLDSSYNIVRGNSFYNNNLAGITMSSSPGYKQSPRYNRIYQNTFFNNGLNQNSGVGQELMAGIGMASYGGPGKIERNAIKNNILHSNPRVYGTKNVSLKDQAIAGNWEEAGDPLFVNATETYDPSDAALPDLHLQAGSPAIDKGAFLAQITSAAGSGTTFQVDDAGYFMDGWGIVQGDTIQLLGTEQTARITKVDYKTNTITVSSDITWTQSQGIALAYQGAAPDIGAYEYQINGDPVAAAPPAPADAPAAPAAESTTDSRGSLFRLF